MKKSSVNIKKLTCSAMFLALALLLPLLTGQIPEVGSMLCPMHIPVLLCGFICGWPWGLAVGLIAPLLRSLIFGRPELFPKAIAMAFELCTYGAVSGLLYRLLPRKPVNIYIALLAAMIAGRAVWGGAQYLLLLSSETSFTMSKFIAGAVTTAIPGIILQIVLIPPIVLGLRRAGAVLNE